MKIAILVEGRTELAFKPHLRRFLQEKLAGRMPRLKLLSYDGRIPKGDALRRVVVNSLRSNDAVIALTDVYTGSSDFVNAADAKAKMRDWVGAEQHFYPHAAQYDFEAWLLPFWADIQRLAGHNKNAPPGSPESVNHNHPPSWHISQIFRSGPRTDYSKPRDANRILSGRDLAISAAQCPELKAFLNRILELCGGALL